MAAMCRFHSVLTHGLRTPSYQTLKLVPRKTFGFQKVKIFSHQARNSNGGNLHSSLVSRVCSLRPGAGIKTIIAFSMPLSFKSALDRLQGKHTMVIPRVDLEDCIPREVYRDITIYKTQPGFFMRIVYFCWNILRTSFRTIRIIYTLVPLLCLYPLTCLSVWINDKWWDMMIFAIESMGPTFIKLGQWASTRRDLFSQEFCDKMSRLHRRTKPHSWYFTKKKLEKSFGKKWKEILKFDDKHHPIGSGCVAQVYKAYMPQEMVLDDDVLSEILTEIEDQDDPKIMDAFEILGFQDIIGQIDSRLEDDLDSEDQYKGKRVVETAKLPKAVPLPSISKNKQQSEKSSSSNNQENVRSAREDPSANAAPTGGEQSQSELPPGLVPVAVKVLHPGIYRAVQRDIHILRFLAKLVEFFCPRLRWLSVRECVEEFAELMEKQIDLRFEARFLEKFNANFEDIPNVRFPRPVRPFVKRSILVETFEEGEPMSKFMKRDGDTHFTVGLKEKLAEIGIDALLQMIFHDNFVHGDLHPGNILVQNAMEYEQQDDSKLVLVDVCDTLIINVKPCECPIRLVLLDVGIVSQLSEKDKENFTEVFRAVVIGEGERVGELLLNHASFQQCENEESFKKDIAQIVQTARQETLRLGKIKASELLSSVLNTLSKHKVKLESNFASIIIAIMVLEGLGRTLDPELDLLEKARPILLSST